LIPDYPALANALPAYFELRLHESNAAATGLQDSGNSRKNHRQRNERDVDRDDIRKFADIRGLEKPGVFFDRYDARILPHAPIELLDVDIDRVDTHRTRHQKK